MLVMLADMKRRRETDVTLRMISERIAKAYGVRIGVDSIQGHYASCLETPWSSL